MAGPRTAAALAPPPALVPAPAARGDAFPLTELQQAYWIARSAGVELGEIAVHCYQELDCHGLDLPRFGRAVRALIARHDMLRAVVLPDGRQCILDEVPRYEVPRCDLAALPEPAATRALQAIRRSFLRHLFRADQWPLFALQATLLAAGRVRLHFAFDGLVVDGWSYHVLFRDLVALYRDPGAPLPSLALSFRDYVLAAAELRGSPAAERSRAYWRSRAPDLPPPPPLPVLARPRAAGHPGFGRRSIRLAAEPWRRLAERAGAAGLTPTAVVLAAYADVLTTWSGVLRFALAVPRFNRLPLHPQVSELVGEFASFTVLAVEGAAGEPFAARARRLQAQLWRDLEHAWTGGVEVLRELARQEGGAGAAVPVVFTSTLGLARGDASAPLAALGELVYRVTQTPQVWLDCLVYEDAGSLRCDWDAVETLFPPGLLDDMLGAFERLLLRLSKEEEAWDDTRRRLLPPAQRALYGQLDDTDAPLAEEAVHAAFARQAVRQPGAVAVAAPDRTLTYGELDRLSARLAARLRRLGAGRGRLVAVVLPKGWEQAVAVLAVLRAGAAYVPIDPELPAERFAHLLAHAAAELALTDERRAGALPWPPAVRRVLVAAEETAAEDVEEEAAATSPDDLAYVLYTSGSTGLPKGVMVAHRGLVNALAATAARFAVGPADRVLALTALHHDMSVFDLLGTLGAGGMVVVPSADGTRDPGHWLDLLCRHEVTIWNSVPAMLEMLLDSRAGHDLPRPPALRLALRLAFLGGDWIPLSLPGRLRALCPGVEVVSVGGPTETTLWNIWHPVGEVLPEWKSIPYGRPIANNRYRVLNEALEPCPVWVPGELYCAGVGLAAGYWRDEEQTRRSFITCPETGERLFRTGDRGRLLPDGTLELLGRTDLQVKLQGQRIELGEIEAALGEHPQVSAAVVTAAEEGPPRLLAHVVLKRSPGHGDGGERAQFKLGQPGLRRFAADRAAIPLDGQRTDGEHLAAAARRRSHRRFGGAPLPLPALGELLECLRPIHPADWPLPKYLYPSAGGLYPVQVYLEVQPGRVEELAGGVYYHDPQEHRLVALQGEPAAVEDDHLPVNRALFRQAAFALYLVAALDAIAPAYGSRAVDFCLLEAGCMGQLLMSRAPGCGLGLCPIGRMEFDRVRAALGLAADGHPLVHAFAGGAIEAWQSEPAAWVAETFGAAEADEAASETAVLAGLRRFLRQKLPAHMVPAGFAPLAGLPLNRNGKVDRRALARRPWPALAADPAGPPPRGRLERAVAAAWQAVLGVERVGVEDNFFDLGGNSLQLVQVHRRLAGELGRPPASIGEMFRRPTIAALAELLAGGEPQPVSEGLEGRLARRAEAVGRQRPARPPQAQKGASR